MADGISIGQQDPQRDRAMQAEEQDRQARQGGYGADPEERGVDVEGAAPDAVDDSGPADEDYHPGQPEQPDRAQSDGLTGTGPGQPD